jgi:hypothetical protein
MPLRLNVGVSKKLGLPEYSSIGASCNVEVELDNGILHDLDAFHVRVRDAYIACHQAVHDELARLRTQAMSPVAADAASANGHDRPTPPEERPGHRNGSGSPTNGSARTNGARGRPGKPATASQVKAIYAIARAQHADLEGLLRDEYGALRPEELSLADASKFIDMLKAAASI